MSVSRHQPVTIPDVVRDAARRWPDGEALVVGERRWTFTELAGEVDRHAATLVRDGISTGDRVALWAPSSAEWIITALGVLAAGATVVPLNTRYKGVEATDILNRSRARILFTSMGFLGLDFPQALADTGIALPTLERMVLLGVDAMAVFDTTVSGALPNVGPDDISHVQYTSGTTGAPKGAMLRHRAMVDTTRIWTDAVGLGPGDRYLISSPFFHIAGHKTGILACITAGATMVPVPLFDADTALELIERERITVMQGPPTIFHSLLAHPDRGRFDLKSLRLCVTGAATVPVELIRRIRAELPFESVITSYGLTETTGVATICSADDPPEVIAHTSGRPIPGVEVRIAAMDPTRVDGPRTGTGRVDGPSSGDAERTGEILVRGIGTMAGYLDDPAGTAETIDTEGWVHTGDVGRLDQQGNLVITDRLKDMVIVGGFNVYPAEVENLMLAHPALAQVAVVGVADERLGEVTVAYAVLRSDGVGGVDGADDPGGPEGPSSTAEELVAWCRAHMANFKAPRQVVLVEGLPTNAAGKVDKLVLRERARRGTAPGRMPS